MKVNFLVNRAVIIVSILCGVSFGQWNRGAPNVYLSTSTDNVWIGTTSPFNKLDIAGNVGLRDRRNTYFQCYLQLF